MRTFSLRIGDIISFPEEDLTLEVLDIQEDEVCFGLVAPFLSESSGEDFERFQEHVVLLNPTLT
jgi:hypothetical protein